MVLAVRKQHRHGLRLLDLRLVPVGQSRQGTGHLRAKAMNHKRGLVTPLYCFRSHRPLSASQTQSVNNRLRSGKSASPLTKKSKRSQSSSPGFAAHRSGRSAGFPMAVAALNFVMMIGGFPAVTIIPLWQHFLMIGRISSPSEGRRDQDITNECHRNFEKYQHFLCSIFFGFCTMQKAPRRPCEAGSRCPLLHFNIVSTFSRGSTQKRRRNG
jgi:hypothetical protein